MVRSVHPKAMLSIEVVPDGRTNAVFDVHDLGSQLKGKSLALLATITAIEKKSFPATEVFKLDPEILTKPNTRVLYAVQRLAPLTAIAYCVCVRHRRKLLFHKLCVAERFRGQGVGKLLMAEVLDLAKQENCVALELWVDQTRTVARNLYMRFGLEEESFVKDYYGPGRNGIKMSIQFSR